MRRCDNGISCFLKQDPYVLEAHPTTFIDDETPGMSGAGGAACVSETGPALTCQLLSLGDGTWSFIMTFLSFLFNFGNVHGNIWKERGKRQGANSCHQG